MKSQPEKYFGKKFGRLTIVRTDGFYLDNGSKRPKVFCQCDCGNTKTILLKDILNGKTKSCTCLKSEETSKRSSTHRMTRTTEYSIWSNMITRCYNKKSDAYEYYGGRGISVCERWRNSFENFYADMGKRPSMKLTLDRINNNGNYEPTNCRWATKKQQDENKRVSKNARIFTHNNKTMNMKSWATELGINYNTLHWRINFCNIPFETAITYKNGHKKIPEIV